MLYICNDIFVNELLTGRVNSGFPRQNWGKSGTEPTGSGPLPCLGIELIQHQDLIGIT